MSITITTYDDDLRELVETEYFGAKEVGHMLHLSANTVRRYVRDGRFPAYRIGSVVYMSAPMIGEAVAALTQNVGTGIQETPPTLGIAVAPEDQENIR